MPGSPPAHSAGFDDDADVPAGAMRVLVTDDVGDVASGLVELLRLDGFDARMALDGRAALELVASWRPDALLLDISMPGMDGYEVARRLSASPTRPHLMVAVTGHADPERRRRSLEAGFDEHLVKPLDLDRLLELLARARAGDGVPTG